MTESLLCAVPVSTACYAGQRDNLSIQGWFRALSRQDNYKHQNHQKVGKLVHIYTTNVVTSKSTTVKLFIHHKQYKQQKYMKKRSE